MPNTSCNFNKICQELQKLLLALGLPVDEPLRCAGSHPCQTAIDGVARVTRCLNIDNAATITQFIRDSFDGQLPIDRSTVTLNQILRQEPFYCGEIDAEIQQPCQVTSCCYWSDNPWTRNCILYYLLDHHRTALDIKELTFLLDRPSGELRRRTNEITVEMRRWALHHKTEQEEDRLPVRIVTEERCAACGSELTDTAIYDRGYRYCSAACVDRKTPLDLQIEDAYQLPIERVLQICVDSFGAKRPICHALSLTLRQLEELCRRHKIDASHLP